MACEGGANVALAIKLQRMLIYTEKIAIINPQQCMKIRQLADELLTCICCNQKFNTYIIKPITFSKQLTKGMWAWMYSHAINVKEYITLNIH